MASGREISEAGGLLQRIDARAKVVGILALVIVATLIRRPETLAGAYAICLLLAAASRIPARRVARVLLAIPLFSAAIILPATLNAVTPGHPVWILVRPGLLTPGTWHLPPYLAVTDSGLVVAARFVLRTAVCVTLALLLTLTTRPDRLFRGLRAIGAPRLFVMLLSMMERYLLVLLHVAEEIHLAKRSRSISAGTLREEQAWVGAGVGSLFRRTQSLGNNVYLAMLSRGYTGEVRLLDDPPLHMRDWAFLFAVLGAGSALFLLR
jgi:cobalt/nickel transport system permease protein